MYTNIEKVEIFLVLHDKVALLIRRRAERRIRNRHQRAVYIENFDQKMNFCDSDEIEIRLPFCRSLSTFENIFGGLYTYIFYSMASSKRWLEVICVVKSKAIQRNLNIKLEIFKI